MLCAVILSRALAAPADTLAIVTDTVAPALTDTTAVAAADTTKQKTEWVALKNNLLYDAIATPNLQLEIRLARRWSLELGVGFNPFPLDDKRFPKWRHLSVSIAPRYWFCNVFNRGFVSVNAAYVHYNVAGGVYPIGWMYPQVKDYRYQGDAVMAGASYGWHFAVSPHFSVELEAGVDAGYSWYEQFECKHCGNRRSGGGRWLVLPKLGVNISIPLGGDDESLARRCECELLEDTVSDEPLAVSEEPSVGAFDSLPLYIPAYRLEPQLVRFMPRREAMVPYFEPQVDQMHRLRSRLLRDAEEYEPYNTNMALSADPRNVFLFFDVNVTKMDRSFIQNDMLMDSIMSILGDALADSTIHIAKIQIVGFASFDGRLESNVRLAGIRANTIKDYMQSVYPIPDSTFVVCNGGESWAELQYQLEKVTFDCKEEVLAAIKHIPDPDQREALIKKLHEGDTYRYMRDELKHILRNLGCITIFIENGF